MSDALIEGRNLTAGYNALPVVRDLDIEIRQGEIVALLGPNGAGKTTTVLTLCGELQPLGGEIHFMGKPGHIALYRRARAGLSLITEERSVFMQMTTEDNLLVGRGDLDYALKMFPELTRRLKIKAGDLSGGEQQMLTLARALSRRPKVLLADELSLGLAPIIVQRLLRTLREAADDGLGVLLVEQHVRQALRISDRVYVMRRGRIEQSGSTAELTSQMSLIEAAYLTNGSTG
jgi:ABC-type branched-subunit amino acid transport system ATPase component